MLTELRPWLPGSKGLDLLNRLEKKDPDQAIPAEYELALSWAVSKIASLEIDRPLGGRKSDIWSGDLLAGSPTVVDVAAISDDPFLDESLMRRAANIINDHCIRVLKNSREHLHYTFLEESGYLPPNRHSNYSSRYFRRRRISRKFALDQTLKDALTKWLSNGEPAEHFRWEAHHIGVIINWKDYVHPMGNVFSSMPSLVYDLRENPLYDVLKAKARQLRYAPSGVRRGIFLGDAGCYLLRDLNPGWHGSQSISGRDIISYFLQSSNVDFVAVFSPKRANENIYFDFNNPRLWHVSIFDNKSHASIEDYRSIIRIKEILPKPNLHGYQARSWHQQGFFDPQGRGQYLNTRWTSGTNRMTVRISARALQEYIAGRLTYKQFKKLTTDNVNLFENNLVQGKIISAIKFEKQGNEKDDDYVEFTFEYDPAANNLKT